MENTKTDSRIVWIDWMRVVACFMVILVHSTEPFYLGGDGALILTKGDAYWSSFFDSFVRSCVPLFIIASSYLLFPLRSSAGDFVRRRAVRVLIPFLIWTVVYASVWGEPIQNFRNLVFNFNYAAGHLWFVYMLVGMYMLMPLLSPWAEKVSKRELQIYLFVCFFTTLFPSLRDWLSGGELSVIYGTSGLPRQAFFPLWGECSWNSYGMFYYFSGFIGYLLLGLYFRRFVGEVSWRKTLFIAIPCYLVGFVSCFGGFLWRVFDSAAGVYPVGGTVVKAVWWETTWTNDTVGVALMAVAWILLFRKIKASGVFYQKVLLPISKVSYGIYLSHLLVLVPVCGFFRGWLGIGEEGMLGLWTTPVQIILSSICGFICVAISCLLIKHIPKVGKYIVG